ncbi:MAG: GNAT family N-acetyltransferase [Erysipelotrichaceae bacterium]|nr:GNAT family N-acetyltransferase [Erysipelotrichaceae bacterium]
MATNLQGSSHRPRAVGFRLRNRKNFIYEEDDEIKGMINMRLEHQLHHGGIVAEIMELFVKEKYRLNGIGKKLLAEAIKIARDEGCLRIELSSSNWRTDSHRFYEDNGFSASHVNLTLDLQVRQA